MRGVVTWAGFLHTGSAAVTASLGVGQLLPGALRPFLGGPGGAQAACPPQAPAPRPTHTPLFSLCLLRPSRQGLFLYFEFLSFLLPLILLCKITCKINYFTIFV